MIRAFSDEDLDAAAALLQRRHERHRVMEPLLPAEIDARAEIGKLWAKESASGAFAAGGYVLGWSNPNKRWWGPNVWVEAAGHGVDDPELVRDLYAHAATAWLEQGLKAHYVVVPAGDHALVDAWFRLGFGAQHAYGICEIPDVEWPPNVRRATADDVEQLVAIAPRLQEHQGLSPVFSSVQPQDDDEVRADIVNDLGSDRSVNLLVEAGGRVVGNFFACPVEDSGTHSGLARPAGAALLAFAVTDPRVRGTGVGVALTDACFAWARERGYETMVTDWRVTNLLSSRFWPRRGFRTTFLRLHRLIA
jgi:GNAT superfamily N-acetyltransferase